MRLRNNDNPIIDFPFQFPTNRDEESDRFLKITIMTNYLNNDKFHSKYHLVNPGKNSAPFFNSERRIDSFENFTCSTRVFFAPH